MSEDRLATGGKERQGMKMRSGANHVFNFACKYTEPKQLLSHWEWTVKKDKWVRFTLSVNKDNLQVICLKILIFKKMVQ